jgi:restriction system protein
MPEHRAHAHGESLLLTTTDLDRLRALHWEDFEHLIAAAYRRMGYAVRKAGGAKPDGGVDIVLEAHGMRTYVQCKQWQSWKVGVNIVRELYGVMAKDHIDRGIVITCGEFTKEAKDYCRDLPIELVDGNGVIALLRDLDVTQFQAPPVPPVVVPQSPVVSESNDTPACPNCGALMVTRTATRGAHAGSQFWGCPHYPRCRGTRQYPSTT